MRIENWPPPLLARDNPMGNALRSCGDCSAEFVDPSTHRCASTCSDTNPRRESRTGDYPVAPGCPAAAVPAPRTPSDGRAHTQRTST